MLKHPVPRLILCLLIALGATAPAMGQRAGRGGMGPGGQQPGQPGNKPGNQPDLFLQGQSACELQQYLSAVDLFNNFIGASAGDARIPTAKKLLLDAWSAAAEKLWNEADFPDAVATWGDFAEAYKDQKEGADAKALARQRAGDKFTELIKAGKFRPAIDLADAYKAHFGGEAALIDVEVLRAACVEMLAQAIKGGADPQTTADLLEQVLADAVTAEQLQTGGVSVWAIRAGMADAMLRHGELNRAIAYATKWLAESPADMKEKFQQVINQALVARAEAYGRFGNLPMLAQALSEMDGVPLDAAGKATQARLSDEVKKRVAVTGNAAHVLKLDAPINGTGKWTDDGAGYTIDGTVTLGGATITVTPGFVLDNGTIKVQKGSLEIEGTVSSPVIFRHVHLEAELGASVTAKGAIFEDCTFTRTGGGILGMRRLVSRWKFSGCLISNSTFASLGMGDFGIEMSDCVIADGKMPSRFLFGRTLGDAARTYHDDSNQVLDDAFIRCEISPSFAWVTQRSYFERCKVTPATEMWRSTTSLAVKLAVSSDDLWFTDLLKYRTTDEAQGGVTFSASAVANSRVDSMVFFQYVGMGSNGK